MVAPQLIQRIGRRSLLRRSPESRTDFFLRPISGKYSATPKYFGGMHETLGTLLQSAATANAAGGVVDHATQLHPWAVVDDAAASLASFLVAHGVEIGDRVAVLHPKSVESFIAVHAIVRCGGVVVPIDPLAPTGRVDAVLRSCVPRAIIGEAATLASRASDFIGTQTMTLVVSGDVSTVTAIAPTATTIAALATAVTHPVSEMPQVAPDDLAYIIFTSGSTGRPKGIVHTHRSALAYAENALAVHELVPTDRVAGTAPLHFDMSTLELYATPLAGATALTITEPTLRFPASLSARLAETATTVIYAVPYQLRQLSLRGDLARHDLSSVRQLAFGGEQFAPGVLLELSRAFPQAELLNVYGPAEVNGIVSRRWAPSPSTLSDVPIGHPWAGVRVLVRGNDEQAVAPGEDGELLVSCASQMVGYWDQPDLTDTSFEQIDGERWYRTGDLVRTSDDGELFFLGRADLRVKVRGVRLELESIESVLADVPGIDSAVAGVSEDADGVQRVVAWVLPSSDPLPTVADVRSWCSTRLPASAVPTEVRFVEDFAQTASGKIDRKAVRDRLAGPSSDLI